MQRDFINEKENLKVPEKNNPSFDLDNKFESKKENIEREITPLDKQNIAEELKREIEMMETNEELKEEAKKKVKKIEFLGQQEKIEHLLKIAKERGVLVAVQVAKETNDPHLLDVLHDILAKEGYYKNFIK